MRWLVSGADGMLGLDVVSLLGARGHHVTGLGRARLDITDGESVTRAVSGHDVVLNCAAWTEVDAAEEDEARAFTVNAVGAAHLARACAATGAKMVQVSTDYVFDGRARSPYRHDAPVQPISAYGRTKAAGEWAVRAELPERHLVVRTAWLYGAHGTCFPRTIQRVAAERGEASVVDDQIGQPTWTRDVADVIERLVSAGAPAGTYHATAAGEASWFEFAQVVCASAGLDAVLRPTRSEEFPRPAPRPSYSVLGHDALAAAGVAPIGEWRGRWERAAPQVLGDHFRAG